MEGEYTNTTRIRYFVGHLARNHGFLGKEQSNQKGTSMYLNCKCFSRIIYQKIETTGWPLRERPLLKTRATGSY